jgi:hypothetical protein
MNFRPTTTSPDVKLPVFSARIRDRWPKFFRRGDTDAIISDLRLLELRHGIHVDWVIANWPANKAIAKVMEVIESAPEPAKVNVPDPHEDDGHEL